MYVFSGTYKEHLSIIAVGGSTTECFYLSDGKSWPELLAPLLGKSFGRVWVNNAGMDGHSTFGHAVLLKDYLLGLKPRAIVFLTGLNDMGLAGAGPYDKLLTGEGDRPLAARLFLKAAAHSRTLALAQNIYLYSLAKKAGLAHSQMDLKSLKPVSAGPELAKTLRARHAPFVQAYALRLKALVSLSRQNGIEPVIATQPLLCGKGKDPETGTDLALLPMSPGDFVLIARGLARGRLVQFDRGDVDKLAAYVEAIRTLVVPAMLPYYYRQNPGFWEWLRKEGGQSIPKP